VAVFSFQFSVVRVEIAVNVISLSPPGTFRCDRTAQQQKSHTRRGFPLPPRVTFPQQRLQSIPFLNQWDEFDDE